MRRGVSAGWISSGRRRRKSRGKPEEGWIFDGEILTHSNMAQNGTFEGTIKVIGEAPGEISYEKVILKKGLPGGGDYLITTPDFKNAEVSYTVYLKSKGL